MIKMVHPRKGTKGNIGNQNSAEVKKIISQKAKERYKNKKYLEKHRKTMSSKETKEKMSKANTGKVRTDEMKEKYRQRALRQWKEGNKGYHPNKVLANNRNRRTQLEEIMKKELDRKKIKYVEKLRIGKYNADFCVKNKIVVECDEPHWHQNKEFDKKRDKFITKQGYIVLRFISKEIRTDIKSCVKQILKKYKEIRGAE